MASRLEMNNSVKQANQIFSSTNNFMTDTMRISIKMKGGELCEWWTFVRSSHSLLRPQMWQSKITRIQVQRSTRGFSERLTKCHGSGVIQRGRLLYDSTFNNWGEDNIVEQQELWTTDWKNCRNKQHQLSENTEPKPVTASTGKEPTSSTTCHPTAEQRQVKTWTHDGLWCWLGLIQDINY